MFCFILDCYDKFKLKKEDDFINFVFLIFYLCTKLNKTVERD